MSNPDRDLKRACRWLASGNRKKTIHFLVPRVPLYLENPDYYAILGRAYLESGLYDEARTYLSRGLQTDPKNLKIKLIMAVNHLKKKNLAAAVRIWLEILEEYPENKFATKGLNALKKITNPETEKKFFDSFQIGELLPVLVSPFPNWIILLFIIVPILLLLLYFKPISLVDTDLSSIFTKTRPGVEKLVSIDKELLVGNPIDSPVIFPMNGSEISRTLKKAVSYYEKYEDNRAQHELNKIRYSNSSRNLIKRAEDLMQLLSEPEINTLKTNYNYAHVSQTPELYEYCWVLWQGMAANIAVEDETIQFELLVGFNKGNVLEGRVMVYVPFIEVMEPLPLEILAKIELDGEGFRLVAKTLHFLR